MNAAPWIKLKKPVLKTLLDKCGVVMIERHKDNALNAAKYGIAEDVYELEHLLDDMLLVKK